MDMGKLLGNLPAEGVDRDKVMAQAQNIWTMLDEMAISDPKAYRKFIDQQMTEGKKAMEPPKMHMCVKTSLLKPRQETFYINFMAWHKVPEPKSAEDPVPVTGTPVLSSEDSDGQFSYAGCAFCHKVLDEYGLNTKSSSDRDLLINLAIDFLQNTQKISISRNYVVLDENSLYKGDIKLIQRAFLQQTGHSEEQIQDQLSELEKTFGSLPVGAKDTLMSKLSNISTPDSQEVNSKDTSPQIKIPGIKEQEESNKSRKATLIEELPSNGDMLIDLKLPSPKYTMSFSRDEQEKITQISMEIQLPGVKGSHQCQVDISQDDVRLHVPSLFDLHVVFPCQVDDTSSRAKFSKKLCALSLQLPALSK